jgi:hypothetical protein
MLEGGFIHSFGHNIGGKMLGIVIGYGQTYAVYGNAVPQFDIIEDSFCLYINLKGLGTSFNAPNPAHGFNYSGKHLLSSSQSVFYIGFDVVTVLLYLFRVRGKG